MTLRVSIIYLFALACLLPLYARAVELININTADAMLLDTLPGIGPAKAAAIIEYRTRNGSFAAIEAIQDVSGIGPVTFVNMEKLITVGATSTSPAPETAAPRETSVQPLTPRTSYTSVKAVEPITSAKKNIQAYEKAVIAPAEATKLASAGAALPPAETAPRASGLFRSSWTLGLLGVIALAGAAFIFL